LRIIGEALLSGLHSLLTNGKSPDLPSLNTNNSQIAAQTQQQQKVAVAAGPLYL
jgi:hypothetical protein